MGAELRYDTHTPVPRVRIARSGRWACSIRLCERWGATDSAPLQPVMPDDHSKVAPLLPIPNRTVKRLRADDSAVSRVKVGHRQAVIAKQPREFNALGVLLLGSWARARHNPAL